MNKTFLLVLMAIVCNLILGCGASEQVSFGEANTPAEVASQIGDVMATIDEAGRGTTAIAHFVPAFNNSSSKHAAVDNLMFALFPQVQAATCNTAEFSTCSANSVLRNFNSCTIGGYVLAGSVAMSWTGGANCVMSGAGQAIRITPNYTIAANNMSLSATKTGTYGTILTWATGSGTTRVFSYVNDGINRSLSSNGTVLLSLNTRTVTPLTVTGNTRGSRILSSAASGALEIVNATSGETCTFQPVSVAWGTANCNCATSGQWTGTCTAMGNFSMIITGCGVASISYTESGVAKNQTVSLDRCVQN